MSLKPEWDQHRINQVIKTTFLSVNQVIRAAHGIPMVEPGLDEEIPLIWRPGSPPFLRSTGALNFQAFSDQHTRIVHQIGGEAETHIAVNPHIRIEQRVDRAVLARSLRVARLHELLKAIAETQELNYTQGFMSPRPRIITLSHTLIFTDFYRKQRP